MNIIDECLKTSQQVINDRTIEDVMIKLSEEQSERTINQTTRFWKENRKENR